MVGAGEQAESPSAMRRRGRSYVYVAVCSGPDALLKVGLSDDPLARWSGFHPRWFEAFDLDRSALVEVESRREAQALETALHRTLLEHNCPPPLTMRAQVGGGTEWYRGADAVAADFVREAHARGHVVHLPARAWFVDAVQRAGDRLVGLVEHGLRQHFDGMLSQAQRRALCDLIDAHRALDEDIDARLPPDIDELYRRD